jgi:PLP dependent protein
MNYGYIENNLIRLKSKIDKISNDCNKDPKSIYLIAVSKTFPSDAISAALDFNQLDFGENRVQEMIKKQGELNTRLINWHLIGHLQTNKVKFIIPFVYLIQSLDSFKLALKINSEASKIKRKINCLIQVNTSDEAQKTGCEVSEAIKLAREVSELEYIRLKGFMTVAKFLPDNPNQNDLLEVRNNYKTLKEIFEEVKSLNLRNCDIKYLSMGMSADYEIAIEEGSNMIRIGTSIFGQRNI